MLLSSRCLRNTTSLKSPGLCGHSAETAPELRELCEALNLQSLGNGKTESMCPSQTRAGRKGPADGRLLNYIHMPSLKIGNINTTRGMGHTYPWSASLGTSDTNCGLFSLLYLFTLLIRENVYTVVPAHSLWSWSQNNYCAWKKHKSWA